MKGLNKEVLPVANTNRAFIQLSRFTLKKEQGPTETQLRSTQDVKMVKKMIIWDITNLESQSNFSGSVSLRSVIPSVNVNTNNFVKDTILNLSESKDYGLPLESINFIGKSFEECITIINDFISGVVNGFKNYTGVVNNINNASPESTFPLVITPSLQTLKTAKDLLNGNSQPTFKDTQEYGNFLKFMAEITTGSLRTKRGFFKVWGLKNNTPLFNQPPNLKKEEIKTYEYKATEDVTYATMGGQKLFLLSHDSDGPKGKISLSNTLYGIPQDKFIGGSKNDSILDKTYPTVRGDKLMELISKIVSFLAGHVHPISTVPPTPISTGSGQSISEIFELLADAKNTILNENIRIN